MYFEKQGIANTKQVGEIVQKYLESHPVEYVVVATTTGYTLEVMANQLQGVKLVGVTHVVGMMENGQDELGAERRLQFANLGIPLVTATHVLSGAERGLSRAFGGIGPVEAMAQTLRMFGAGIKVAVECAAMAVDNGAVPYGVDIISIGGTGRGADTAALIRPAHASRIFETKVKKILCKPENFPVQSFRYPPQ